MIWAMSIWGLYRLSLHCYNKLFDLSVWVYVLQRRGDCGMAMVWRCCRTRPNSCCMRWVTAMMHCCYNDNLLLIAFIVLIFSQVHCLLFFTLHTFFPLFCTLSLLFPLFFVHLWVLSTSLPHVTHWLSTPSSFLFRVLYDLTTSIFPWPFKADASLDMCGQHSSFSIYLEQWYKILFLAWLQH